jgi:hypothetical protein
MSPTPYAAIVHGRRVQVELAGKGDPCIWKLMLDGRQIDISEPEDLLTISDPATADFGHFTLQMRTVRKRTLYLASADGKRGLESTDVEQALWSLMRQTQAPMTCFFCRWSDVEPSTGWGNLGCFIDDGKRYDAYIAAGQRLKWVTTVAKCVWTDEWHSCQSWSLRPKGHGYRGRP